VSYDIVGRWKQEYNSGLGYFKNTPRSGRPTTAFGAENVSKLGKLLKEVLNIQLAILFKW